MKIKIVLFLPVFLAVAVVQGMDLITFADLPHDTKSEMCKKLDLPSLYKFARTCKDHQKYCHNLATLTPVYAQWINKEPEKAAQEFFINAGLGRYFIVKNFLLAGLDPNIILQKENDASADMTSLGVVVAGMGYVASDIEYMPIECAEIDIIDYAKTMEVLLESKRINVNEVRDGMTALLMLIGGMGIQEKPMYLEKDKGQALLNLLLRHGALFDVEGGLSTQHIQSFIAQIPDQTVKSKIEEAYAQERRWRRWTNIACILGAILIFYAEYKWLKIYGYI